MYCIWRACERFHILPPGLTRSWDSLDVWSQAQLLAYDQLRDYEETKMQIALAGAKVK